MIKMVEDPQVQPNLTPTQAALWEAFEVGFLLALWLAFWGEQVKPYLESN